MKSIYSIFLISIILAFQGCALNIVEKRVHRPGYYYRGIGESVQRKESKNIERRNMEGQSELKGKLALTNLPDHLVKVEDEKFQWIQTANKEIKKHNRSSTMENKKRSVDCPKNIEKVHLKSITKQQHIKALQKKEFSNPFKNTESTSSKNINLLGWLGFGMISFLGLVHGKKFLKSEKAFRIKVWTRQNKGKTKLMIGGLHVLSAVAVFGTGKLLKLNGYELPAHFDAAMLGLGAVSMLLYPVKGVKKGIFKQEYLKQKIMGAGILLAGLGLVCNFSLKNSADSNFKETIKIEKNCQQNIAGDLMDENGQYQPVSKSKFILYQHLAALTIILSLIFIGILLVVSCGLWCEGYVIWPYVALFGATAVLSLGIYITIMLGKVLHTYTEQQKKADKK